MIGCCPYERTQTRVIEEQQNPFVTHCHAYGAHNISAALVYINAAASRAESLVCTDVANTCEIGVKSFWHVPPEEFMSSVAFKYRTNIIGGLGNNTDLCSPRWAVEPPALQLTELTAAKAKNQQIHTAQHNWLTGKKYSKEQFAAPVGIWYHLFSDGTLNVGSIYRNCSSNSVFGLHHLFSETLGGCTDKTSI